MHILFFILTVLTGISVPLIPMSSALFPQVGIRPMKIGFNPITRWIQIILLWSFTLSSIFSKPSGWGWAAVIIALWFSFLATALYSKKIFIALEQPKRAQIGISVDAPVLTTKTADEVVAYPLEILVPHHIINDILGDIPVLVSW